MSDQIVGYPKCSYCGNQHNYSADMCRDGYVNRGGFAPFKRQTSCPEPKEWMLKNVGPVPDRDDEEKYDRWHVILGILTSYKYDAENTGVL
jgi:hypothetical protein